MIPAWIAKLMATERARTDGLPKYSSHPCPAELGDKAEIVEIPYGDRTIFACALFERSRGLGLVPSPEFCPGCEYNTDTIRARADAELAQKVAGFVSSNPRGL